VQLAPRFFTSCGESTACQQQQVAAVQAPVQEAGQLHSPAEAAINGPQQAISNTAEEDAVAADMGTTAGLPQQNLQQSSSEDLVAAALACMPDYQRSWALLQQVRHKLQEHDCFGM
jgi:hypothetical protein